MKYTSNLNLKKPDLTDYVNVGDLNDNMDTLDGVVGDLVDDAGELKDLIKIKKNITIASAGWSKVGDRYEYEISDSDITADTIVDVNIRVEDLGNAYMLLSSNKSSNGKVTIYAEDKPSENIIVDFKIVRQVT